MRGTALACVAALGLSLMPATAAMAQEPPADIVQPQTSAPCTGIVNSSSVATAEGTVSTSEGSPEGARVYAYELETGGLTCVTVEATGSYSLPLPGVTYDGSTTRPADGWIISVSPAPESNLGGTSRLLTWDAVVLQGTVQGVDLRLERSELQVTVTASDVNGTLPALVCSSAGGLTEGPCGIAIANGSDPLRLGMTGARGAEAQALAIVGSGGYAGYGSSETGSSLQIALDEQSPSTCGDFSSVSGRITRIVDGRVGTVRATVRLQGVTTSSGYPQRIWLGSGDSLPDGRYTLCLEPDQLAQVPSGAQWILAAEPLTGGITSARAITRDCLPDCNGIDVALATAASIGGTVSLEGVPTGPGLTQHPTWYLNKASGSGSQVSAEYDITWGRTDALGRWGVAFLGGLAPLVDGAYLIDVSPKSQALGHTRVRDRFSVASSTGTRNVTLLRSNLYGRITNAAGNPQPWTWIQFEPLSCAGDCDYGYADADREGWFAVSLSDGRYLATAYPNWSDDDASATNFEVVVDGGEFTLLDGQPASAPLVLPLASVNAAFTVTSDGAAAAGSYIYWHRWIPSDSGGSYRWISGRSAGDDGRVRVRLEPGSYRVTINPPYETATQSTIEGWLVTGSGDDIVISRCRARPMWGSDPCPAGASQDVIAPAAAGEWVLPLSPPTLIATVTSPDGASALPSAQVCNSHRWSDASGNTWAEDWCTESDSAGRAGLRLDAPGTYEVRVAKPWDSDEPWAPATYQFEVSDSGEICARSSSSSCIPLDSSAVRLAVRGANVTASVRGAGGAVLNSGWVEVLRGCQGHDLCREWITSTNVSRQGTIHLRLDASDDTYYVRVHPYGLDDGSIATTFQLRVADEETTQALNWLLRSPNVTGRVTDWLGEVVPSVGVQVQRQVNGEWQWVDSYGFTNAEGRYGLLLDPGTYRLRAYPQTGDRSRMVATSTLPFTVGDDPKVVDIELRRPNLTGTVVESSGAALGNSWIEVQKWYEAYGYYGWSPDVPGTDTSFAGAFGLDLPAGKWRLVVNPPWGSMSVSRTIVPVVSDGTGVCLDTGAACNAGAYLDSTYSLVMQRPNASGRVVMPDGLESVNYAWVEVRRWSSPAQTFVWDFDLPSATSGPQGTFSLALPQGRWQLTAHPSGPAVRATRNSIDLTVDSTGLCLTASAPCTVDDSIGPGALRIALRAPNVEGSVTAGAAPAAGVWVYAQRWQADGQGWQWTDNHASTDSDGSYILTLREAGAYRVVASNHGRVRGFAGGESFLAVVPDGVCVSDPPGVGSTPADQCASPEDAVELTTALTQANLVAIVEGDGTPAPWMWVQLQELVNGGWSWREGTPTMQDGSVSLALQTDDTTRFRLHIDPAWSSTGDYSRTYFDLIAYLSDGQTLVCALPDWDPSARSCARPITNASPATVSLATGGLKGTVTDPSGQEPIAWTWVHAQRWTDTWSQGYYSWQWDDAYSYSRPNGNVNLPIVGPGIFRITAHPRWPNLEGHARGTHIVRIYADGSWCTVQSASGTSADPFGSCVGQVRLANERVPLPLASSNVVGSLVFNDTVNGQTVSRGMPYGWVGVIDSRGQWVADTGTSDQGRFALRLDDDGDYILLGYPNWAFSQRPPVRIPITVVDGVVTYGLTNGLAILDLDAVQPNVTLTLTGIDIAVGSGQRLIAVQRDEGYVDGSAGELENWVDAPDYTAMSSGGVTNRARFALPTGRYRLSVVPELGYEIVGANSLVVIVTDPSLSLSVDLAVSERSLNS